MCPLPTTRWSLLEALRAAPDDAGAWGRFAAGYREPVVRLCRRFGLQGSDADDVAQEVFGKLFRGLGGYDPAAGRFRPWLTQVLRNAVRDWARRRDRNPAARAAGAAEGLLEGLADGGLADELAAELEPGLSSFPGLDPLMAEAVARVRRRVEDRVWTAAARLILGEAGKEVADALGMTVAAVYRARARVVRMLREEALRLRTEGEEGPHQPEVTP